jgi:prepilin-type processing-associated H-X9-DG protein
MKLSLEPGHDRHAFTSNESAIRIADISDGTSNTLLAGERPASADFQFGWWYAGVGQRFTGSAEMVLGVREPNLRPVTKGSCPPGTYSYAPGSLANQCDMFHFWSPHSGGASFLFADGSVRFLPYAAASVMPALAAAPAAKKPHSQTDFSVPTMLRRQTVMSALQDP